MAKREKGLLFLVEPLRLLVEEEAPEEMQGHARAVRATQAQARREEVQLVGFRLGPEEYALEIGAVREIVRFPGVASSIPNSPPYLTGVVTLRARVLPVVSLRTLFGLGEDEIGDRTRIVVANLPGRDGAVLPVGLLVDEVTEVLRVPEEAVTAVPSLLRAAGEGIKGICKLDEGRRLVYVLEPSQLLPDEGLVELESGAGEEDVRQEGTEGAGGVEEQLVTYRLGSEEFASAITEVKEIIRVPEIVSIPRAPEFVEGVINLRGTIVPVLDLRRRLGMSREERGEHARIVVVELEGLLTGLIVDGVREVLKVPRESIEPPPDILAGVDTRFLRGIAKVNGGGRLVILLDLGKVLSFEEKEELLAFGEEARETHQDPDS